MKKIALHWQILLGMLLGVIVGLVMTSFEGGREIIQDWIKPFGKIFINSLKLIAIPLILAALIKGVSDLKDNQFAKQNYISKIRESYLEKIPQGLAPLIN